jgi:cardiolipin synthase
MRLKGTLLMFILILMMQPVALYGAEQAGTAEPESSEIDEAWYTTVDREEKIEIVPTNAYFGKKEFFIRFLAGDYAFHSSGSYPESEEGKSSYHPASHVLKLEKVQMEEWEDLPDDVREVTILPREDWLPVINAFHEKITPRDSKKGIVVEFLHEREYFLYFDSRGDLQATFLEDKPPDIGVSTTYSEQEITRMRLEYLREALAAGDLPGPAFLVRLPEKGAFSYPFFAANLERGIIGYIQFIPDEDMTEALYRSNPLRKVGHLAVPSFLGMIVRPFTALHQLFMLPVDSIEDTVMPNSLKKIPDDEPIPELYEGPGMDLGGFEKQLDELTETRPSTGTIEYLIDGKAFYPRFIDAFHKARKNIDLRTYIFDNDDYAYKIASVLKDKADQGLRVRVLLDGTPTISHSKPKKEKLPEGYTPPSTIYGYMEKDSDVRVRLRPNTWFSLDHSKMTIIDREFAFLGGMNIGKEYRYHWHDMMMELRGPVVGELQYKFDKAWAISGWLGDFASAYVQGARKPTVQPTGKDYPIRVLLSSQGDSDIYWAQLAAIDNAKKYIYIENAYFADNHILYRLIKARRRGVDVRVILPKEGNWGAMNASNLVTANRMFANGIRVYLYPGMSHIKAAVFDGWACIGSANFDRASFRLNVETNIATSYEPKVQEIIDTLFLPDFEKSDEMTELFPETWQHRFMEAIANQM